MPGPTAALGATVLCAHAGQAHADRVQPARDGDRPADCDGEAVHRRRLHPAAALGWERPCVTAQWSRRRRVTSMGQPLLLLDSLAMCVPTGTPLTVM